MTGTAKRPPILQKLVALVAFAAVGPAVVGPAAAGNRIGVELVGHFPSGKRPATVHLVDGGKRLLVANLGDSTVDVFDTESMRLERTYPVESVGHGAWGVATSADGRRVLVSNWVGKSVTVFDRASGSVVKAIEAGIKPSYIAMSQDGSRAYAAGLLSGDVTIMNVNTLQPLRKLEIGRKPMGVAASSDGRWLYVAACASNKIAKVDLKHEVVLESFGAALAETTNLAITPDGAWLVAAGDDDRMLLIDTEKGDVTKVKVGGSPAAVALSPEGTTAFVALHGEGTVVVVDLGEKDVYHRIPVGQGPIHVVTNGKRLYTANERASSISVHALMPVEPAEIPPPVFGADG